MLGKTYVSHIRRQVTNQTTCLTEVMFYHLNQIASDVIGEEMGNPSFLSYGLCCTQSLVGLVLTKSIVCVVCGNCKHIMDQLNTRVNLKEAVLEDICGNSFQVHQYFKEALLGLPPLTT